MIVNRQGQIAKLLLKLGSGLGAARGHRQEKEVAGVGVGVKEAVVKDLLDEVFDE